MNICSAHHHHTRPFHRFNTRFFNISIMKCTTCGAIMYIPYVSARKQGYKKTLYCYACKKDTVHKECQPHKGPCVV